VRHVPWGGFEPNEHGWLAAFTVTVAGVDADQLGAGRDELAAAVAAACGLGLDRVLVHVGSEAEALPDASPPPAPDTDASGMQEGSESDASSEEMEEQSDPDSSESEMEAEQPPDEDAAGGGAGVAPGGVEVQVLVMRQPLVEEDGAAGARGTAPGPAGDDARGGGGLWERLKACAREEPAAPLVFLAPPASAAIPSASARQRRSARVGVLGGSARGAAPREARVDQPDQPCLPGVRRVRRCEWGAEACLVRDAAKAAWGREGADFFGAAFGERDAVVGVYADELGAVVGRVEGGRREEVLRALPGKAAACCASGVGVENVAVRRVDSEHPAYSSNPSAGWGLFVAEGGEGLPAGAVLGEYVGAVSVLEEEREGGDPPPPPGEFELCLSLSRHPSRREDAVQLVVDAGACRNAMAFANVHPKP